MPNTIPAYFAQRPAGTSGLPRAPAAQLAATGQGVEAQAITGFGGALTDTSAILAKWYEREGSSQFDTSRANAQDLIGNFERTPYPNADSHKAGFKSLIADIGKLSPKNKSGAAKFKSWARLDRASLEKLSGEKMIRMIAKQGQISLFESLNRVSNITDRKKAKAEIKLLIQGGLDDGSIKTAAQAIALQEKATNNWLEADVWRRATSTVRPDGEVDFSEAAKWFSKAENIKGIPSDVIDSMLENARTQANLQKGRDNEKLELQREEDRDEITKAIEALDPNTISLIENSYLDETEQRTERARLKAETKRRADGVEIITDPEVRSGLYSGIMSVLRGDKTHAEVLAEGKSARFGYLDEEGNFIEPTFNDTEFKVWEKALNTKYEKAYDKIIARVDAFARGTLLQPDSLGIIRNAPVRWKHYGDFQQSWLEWVAKKGESLKLADMYPEGRRMATLFQVSDEEAERQEVEMNAALAEREKPTITPRGETVKLPPLFGGEVKLPAPPTKPSKLELVKSVGKENAEMEMDAWQLVFDMWDHFNGSTQKKIREALDAGKSFSEIVSEDPLADEISKRVGAVDTPHRVLPRPTNKEQYDKLPSGTRYIAPNGMELTKK